MIAVFECPVEYGEQLKEADYYVRLLNFSGYVVIGPDNVILSLALGAQTAWLLRDHVSLVSAILTSKEVDEAGLIEAITNGKRAVIYPRNLEDRTINLMLLFHEDGDCEFHFVASEKSVNLEIFRPS